MRRLLFLAVVLVVEGVPSVEDFQAATKNSYEQAQDIIRTSRKKNAQRRARERVWHAHHQEEKRKAHHAQKHRERKLFNKKRLDNTKKKKKLPSA